MTEASDFLAIVARAQMRSGAGDWAEAAELWARVTAANPVNGDYWARLAEARFLAQEHEAALSAYRKVAELGVRATYHSRFDADAPELIRGEVAYRIACCQAALGRREEALDGLAAALDAGFRDLDRAWGDDCWDAWREDARLRDLLGIIDAERLSRDEGWRYDLRFLAREIKRRAYAPFALGSEEDFDRRVDALSRSIPGLGDTELMVAMMRLVRQLDDGHARVEPVGEFGRLLEIEMFLFPEGLFVIAAGPGYEELLGARVDAIGGQSVEALALVLEEVIARDNDQQVNLEIPLYLRSTAILHGLGITDDLGRAVLTVRLADGTSGEVTVDAAISEVHWDRYPAGWTALVDTVAGRPRPLHLRHRELPYWFEYLAEFDLVYFQYNAVRDHPVEPLAAFCDRLFGFIDGHRVGRLVIDLRWNGGGDTFLSQPLLHHLIGCPLVNRRGALFVIIGRLTFSAAQNTATAIDREAQAIFVGEATGSRPNFIGEAIWFELPYSKVRANVSDLYWQTSWPRDYRTWIAPDLYAPPTFGAYSQNRDPAMEAILSVGEFVPGV